MAAQLCNKCSNFHSRSCQGFKNNVLARDCVHFFPVAIIPPSPKSSEKPTEDEQAPPPMAGLLLHFGQPLLQVSEALTFGAEKYPPNNWLNVSRDKHLDAMMRHLLKTQEEVNDPESGLPHLAHAISRGLMALHSK